MIFLPFCFQNVLKSHHVLHSWTYPPKRLENCPQSVLKSHPCTSRAQIRKSFKTGKRQRARSRTLELLLSSLHHHHHLPDALPKSLRLHRPIPTPPLATSSHPIDPQPYHSVVLLSLSVGFAPRGGFGSALIASAARTDDARWPPFAPLPPPTAEKAEMYKGLEAALGSPFGSDPLSPPPNPLILVISGPSGVGKDAVIKRLVEIREGIHFVVTATSRPQRPGELDGKDYYFVTKEEFLSMVERNELLEYALVYGDYKGIPKQQIRDYMAKGFDIVLRVDIQGAATLRSILGNSAVFIFLVAESEAALVKRLVARNTETPEMLLVRIATAREEVKHMKKFDYIVMNAEGKLDNAVKLVESITDAEKARVWQRKVKI